jgi:hypothetical protein
MTLSQVGTVVDVVVVVGAGQSGRGSVVVVVVVVDVVVGLGIPQLFFSVGCGVEGSRSTGTLGLSGPVPDGSGNLRLAGPAPPLCDQLRVDAAPSGPGAFAGTFACTAFGQVAATGTFAAGPS